mgnify:CR=1 FL=1
MMARHIHVLDRDLNHYVIPADKRGEWEEFLDAIEEWRWHGGVRPQEADWVVMVDKLDAERVIKELSSR